MGGGLVYKADDDFIFATRETLCIKKVVVRILLVYLFFNNLRIRNCVSTIMLLIIVLNF